MSSLPPDGGLYLRPLDAVTEETGLFYARYMDDWIVTAPSRWKLRRAERGFDFLSYRFTPDGLGVAEKTVQRFVERATRLYEQEPGGALRLLPVWGIRYAAVALGEGWVG